jgi:hypothetical protein
MRAPQQRFLSLRPRGNPTTSGTVWLRNDDRPDGRPHKDRVPSIQCIRNMPEMISDRLHVIALERRSVGDNRTGIATGAHVRENIH